MVAKYDTKSLMSLLVAIFLFLNLDVNGTIEPTTIDDEEESIFGVVTSNEVTLKGLLRNELFLFRHLLVKLKGIILPLTWWKTHEVRFPNLSFVAQHVFGIPNY